MLYDAQNYGEAVGRYEMAFSFDENNPESIVKYANAYAHVNPPFAIEILQKYVNSHPNSALAQRELAEMNYEHKYWKKAAELYGNYIQNPNHFPEDKARYVVLLYWGEDYEQSLKLAEEILRNEPNNFLMQRLVMLNQNKLGRYEDAAANANKFFTSNPGGNFTSLDYITYADALTHLGQDSLAVVQYEIAAKREPENADLLKELSAKYSQNREFVKGAEAYDAYLKLQENPTLNDFYGMATRCLQAAATVEDANQAVQMADLGIEYIDKVISRAANPNPAFHSLKGRLYIARNAKKPDQNAVDSYMEVLALLDQDPENMNPQNPNNKLKLYNEAYSFILVFYSTPETADKEKAAEYQEKYNTVKALQNPGAATAE